MLIHNSNTGIDFGFRAVNRIISRNHSLKSMGERTGDYGGHHEITHPRPIKIETSDRTDVSDITQIYYKVLVMYY